jgi:hypothetical protein
LVHLDRRGNVCPKRGSKLRRIETIRLHRADMIEKPSRCRIATTVVTGKPRVQEHWRSNLRQPNPRHTLSNPTPIQFNKWQFNDLHRELSATPPPHPHGPFDRMTPMVAGADADVHGGSSVILVRPCERGKPVVKDHP